MKQSKYGINKLRVSIGLFIGAVSYLLLLFLLKIIFGLDMCLITQDLPVLQKINDFIMSNVYIECAYRTFMFTIDLYFIISICTRNFNFKRNILICLILYVLNYILNLLIYFFGIPSLVVSTIIPAIIVIMLASLENNKGVFLKLPNRLNNILTSTIIYLILVVTMSLLQQVVFYLTMNIFKFDFVLTNIFNLILISINFWVIYCSLYFVAKFLYERRLENGR